ncbi:transmembrane protease serine 9-like [Hermetia illucens]|nr:transmembrane protease serine 9-like [Hermetia illucens]
MAFKGSTSIGLLVLIIYAQYSKGQINGESRIVGGTPIQGHVPYQASLQGRTSGSGIVDRLLQLMLMQSLSEYSHYCGACIISKEHVLTAAHCMDGADHTQITVVVGTSSRLRGGRRYAIASYVNHPDYGKLRRNDISIITVAEPFTFGPTINKIDFRGPAEILSGMRVKLSGWGYTTPLATFSLPIGLRAIILRIISNEECRSKGYNVSEDEMCTSSGILRGACMGDSGGPLVTLDGKKLIGLVSRGSSLCGAGRPEVYTRVAPFVSWIEKEIGLTSSPETQASTSSPPAHTSTVAIPTTTPSPATTPKPTTKPASSATPTATKPTPASTPSPTKPKPAVTPTPASIPTPAATPTATKPSPAIKPTPATTPTPTKPKPAATSTPASIPTPVATPAATKPSSAATPNPVTIPSPAIPPTPSATPPLSTKAPTSGSIVTAFTPVGAQTVQTLAPTTAIPATSAPSTTAILESSTGFTAMDNVEAITEPAAEVAAAIVTEPTTAIAMDPVTEQAIEPEIVVTPSTIDTTIQL